jgi:hypothetical protein
MWAPSPNRLNRQEADMAEEHRVSEEQASNDPEMILRQVAAANDAFRAAMIRGGHPVYQGRVLCTRGVSEEGLEFVTRAQVAVAGFTEFTEDNDPYGDHTFGAVTIAGKVVWWKIDLFDPNYAYGAADPLDHAQTRRVLTLLFPSEY